MYRPLLAALSAIALATGAATGPVPPVEVMIVGTFHMDNPGHDLHNMKVDDVLTARRQKELADVTERLARFRPTAVMVESQRRDPGASTLPRYREYLAGTLAPSRNEIVQIGFRLAKRMGLEQVYGIDVDGDFPYDAVKAFADSHGMDGMLDELGKEIDRDIGAESAQLARDTIGATLARINEPAHIVAGNHFYSAMTRIGAGDEQPGAALLGAWGLRNFRICARLIQNTQPGDRVVVVYGAGHAFLLRQCIAQTPGFRLVEATAYLP